MTELLDGKVAARSPHAAERRSKPLPWVLLASVLGCVVGLHGVTFLKAEDIASYWHPYVALASGEVQERASQALESCERGLSYQYLKVPCPREPEAAVLKAHRDQYDYDVRWNGGNDVKQSANVVFGFMYGLLAIPLIWSFGRSLVAKGRSGGRALRVAGESLRSELAFGDRTSRRFRRAEEQFSTLKSLREDGLISDKVYEQRKADLKASLLHASASGSGSKV